MKKKVVCNPTNNETCPCKDCGDRFVGCHSKCLKYIDWKQKHDLKLAEIQKQRDMNNLLFGNQQSRNKQLKQEGGLHYGRRNGSR